MTTTLQLRRGTTAQHATFVGANGEVTVDTDKKTLVVNDGVTPGGTPLAREDALTKFVRHDTAAQGLTGTQQGNARTNIGLGNVNNTADVNKPVSTATQSALDGKLDKSGGTLTGALTLSGNAASALGAVPKQQLDSAITSAIAGVTNHYVGGRGQVFTGSGTFTVPAGVSTVKVRGCGGGSGGGTNPSAGGTTSFGDYCTATGGHGISPGRGAGGSIQHVGGRGGTTGSASGNIAAGGAVGGGIGAGGAISGNSLGAPTGLLGGAGGYSTAATGYGNGGGCTNRSTVSISAGSAGGYFEGYITGLTPGATIPVTIGHGGNGGSNGSVADGSAGSPGICIVEW